MIALISFLDIQSEIINPKSEIERHKVHHAK